MRILRRLTIGQKLTSIAMLSSFAALVSASIAFLAYDLHTIRQSLARRILTDAQIVGFNSVSPLLFNDAETATTTLGGLRAEPAIVAAIVRGQGDARPFATYFRDGPSAARLALPAHVAPGPVFAADHLLVSEPIRFEGRPIGTLVIQADLAEIHSRQRRYAGIVLAVLGGSFVLALGISRLMAKTISRPIVRLADTARAVSSQKDYSVRAPAEGRDEIGLLVGTFNEMLDQIQRQDSDLKEARADLERRVDTRTRDLAAANKELEAFSYSVSHDLRAPLRAIDGFSKAVLSGYGPQLDERGRHYLERVRAGTQRMAQLIDDLLGLARVSRRQLVRQRVNLSEVAGQVAAELARRQPSRQVRLDVQPGLSAEVDPHLLTIVLENLMGNAWKFTGKKAEAHVEVGQRADGPEPAFYVRDNGAGFDMEYADKLFGAFQRLHADTDFEGTGIGLATVQRIVARHGGRIWAEGGVDKGATFYFTLERNP
ncbi:MAG: histidine kinase [Acidobacteria bacterium]|nr:MAG: histidine kinase [Acidobacteriota bacterium]